MYKEFYRKMKKPDASNQFYAATNKFSIRYTIILMVPSNSDIVSLHDNWLDSASSGFLLRELI